MAGRQKKALQEVAVSDFKARCLSLLEEVNKTKIGIRITKRGKAIAEVIPPSPEVRDRRWLGFMAGSTKITGDIVSPVIDLDTIEAMRD
jgi:prevent-host-death family protein